MEAPRAMILNGTSLEPTDDAPTVEVEDGSLDCSAVDEAVIDTWVDSTFESVVARLPAAAVLVVDRGEVVVPIDCPSAMALVDEPPV